MRPVLLFEMGVVVLLVGPASGELDVSAIAVGLQMPVDELRAIIGIDPQQPEGQSLGDLLQGVKDAFTSFP